MQMLMNQPRQGPTSDDNRSSTAHYSNSSSAVATPLNSPTDGNEQYTNSSDSQHAENQLQNYYQNFTPL